MPRTKSYTRNDLVSKAMQRFWRHGYDGTSIDDLVRATGVSRHGLYADTGGKLALFTTCLDAYVHAVVTPAFGQVEQPGATLADVGRYFEHQIALAEASGLPGPGCLIANAMTEIAPHEASIMEIVDRHNVRLRSGFSRAIANSAGKCSAQVRDDLSAALVIFATGLWSMSRTVDDAAELRRAVRAMLQMVQERIAR